MRNAHGHKVGGCSRISYKDPTLEGEVEIVETSPVVVEGGFTILRSDFGVGEPPSRWNPFSIDDEVPVRFRVRF